MFYKNVLITLQVELRQKGGGGSAPVPLLGYATGYYPSICILSTGLFAKGFFTAIELAIDKVLSSQSTSKNKKECCAGSAVRLRRQNAVYRKPSVPFK